MMTSNCDIFTLGYPEAKSVVVSGDIHGDFNLLVYKMCVQYQMTDTVVIVAGDCGFGFEQRGYYDEIAKKNSKRMNQANNWIVFIRGNHDNPAYFDGKTFKHKRFIAVPDYTIVKTCSHTILCVGGAISVDRVPRIKEWNKKMMKVHQYSHNTPLDPTFAQNYYWENESPVYNEQLLDKINDICAIDTVITHTAPSFCELQSKLGLNSWEDEDETLIEDVEQERGVMDAIYDKLHFQNHPLSHWYYGHFHQSWHSEINEVMFRMLDIMEFSEIY